LTTREQAYDAKSPAADEQVRRLLERLVFQANRAARGSSPEAIHDLRVSIRRAEQALVAFKPLLPRKAVKRIRKQLKPVLSGAGAVRDFDIAIRLLQKIDQPAAAELRREIRARRQAAERTLRARLKRLSLRARISQWFADLQLHALRSESAAQTRLEAARSLPRLAQRFFRAGHSALSHDSGEKLHELRIQAKKLRYTLELFVPRYGAAMEERIRKIKSVQNVLGKMNDYRIVLAMARDADCGKKLIAALNKSERRRIRQFRAIWAEQFSASVIGEWKRALKTGWHDQKIPRKPVGSSAPVHDAAARA